MAGDTASVTFRTAAADFTQTYPAGVTDWCGNAIPEPEPVIADPYNLVFVEDGGSAFASWTDAGGTLTFAGKEPANLTASAGPTNADMAQVDADISAALSGGATEVINASRSVPTTGSKILGMEFKPGNFISVKMESVLYSIVAGSLDKVLRKGIEVRGSSTARLRAPFAGVSKNDTIVATVPTNERCGIYYNQTSGLFGLIIGATDYGYLTTLTDNTDGLTYNWGDSSASPATLSVTFDTNIDDTINPCIIYQDPADWTLAFPVGTEGFFRVST